MNLPVLALPFVELKIRCNDEGSSEVFDPLRRRYVALTPEEYVRQQFAHWLVSELKYPASHVANEVSLILNSMRRRCDTVVYGQEGEPLMIIEYKAPSIRIDQKVFDQIVRYNMVLRARYLVVSNGIHHYCCAIDYESGSYHFLPGVPDYNGALKQYL